MKSSPGALFNDSAFRVFCVSMQRTGTTSVGKFFRDFGFHWAGWPAAERNHWGDSWYEGAYEEIFASLDFRSSNAFEDVPWFAPGFFKVVFNRFPNSRFILWTRDPDAWFQSMLRHSGGDVLGKSRTHSKVYRRELEYFDLLETGAFDEHTENQLYSRKVMKLAGHEEHYKQVYRLHAIEVQDFFRRHNPQALHVGTLEDADKWPKLGQFLGLAVPDDYASHENASKKAPD